MSRHALVSALIGAAACSAEVLPAAVDSGWPDAARTDVDAGLPAPIDAGLAPDGGPDQRDPGLAGVMTDEEGQPLDHTMVLCCTAKTCFFGHTETDGSFFFPLSDAVDVALKSLENLDSTPRRAAALVPVHVPGVVVVDVGRVFAPNLPEGVSLDPASSDPQTIAAGDGLELTLRRADLVPELGTSIHDLAARLVPAERLPTYAALAGEEVIAVYALHPFAATSRSPIAVRAPSALPPGTAVKFRTVSEIDGHLSGTANGMADGQAMTTDPGAGIEQLTWLVISR